MTSAKEPTNPIFRDEDFKKSSVSPPIWKPWRCVLVAMRDGVVAVRDSKDPSKTTLTFSVAEWNAFVRGVKAGEFEV